MNNATMIGRVGQDAVLKYLPSGKAICTWSMAIDQGKDSNGEKKAPLWIKATLWEKRAESLAQYIVKGIMVAVSGPVSVEAWVDKSGEAQSRLTITAREFEFCGSPSGSEKAAPKAKPEPEPVKYAEVSDEDIPF